MAKQKSPSKSPAAVAYYRVSTMRQGESGLGLEAQRQAVARLADARGLTLLAEVEEIESGRNREREALARALELCRDTGATLLIAKLDRLARDAAFLLSLRDSGVEFMAADMPDANRLTVGILAMVAENEAEAISKRTSAALQVRKLTKALGFANRSAEQIAHASALGCAVISGNASRYAESVAEMIALARKSGATSLNAIARFLNTMKVPTRNGGKAWTPMQVSRVVSRLA